MYRLNHLIWVKHHMGVSTWRGGRSTAASDTGPHSASATSSSTSRAPASPPPPAPARPGAAPAASAAAAGGRRRGGRPHVAAAALAAAHDWHGEVVGSRLWVRIEHQSPCQRSVGLVGPKPSSAKSKDSISTLSAVQKSEGANILICG